MKTACAWVRGTARSKRVGLVTGLTAASNGLAAGVGSVCFAEDQLYSPAWETWTIAKIVEARTRVRLIIE